MTLPLIHTLRQCSAEEREQVATIIDRGDLSTDELEDVCGLIKRCQGIEYTRERAKEQIATAKERLSLFADDSAKDALFRLADYVVDRNK